MPTIVSLDIGTSKLCALALKAETLAPLTVHSVPNAADVADLPPGFHEQDPSRVRDRAFELLAKLLADKAVQRDDVVGLGITGQMHGVLLASRELKPISNLITWRDWRVLKTDAPGSLDEARKLLDANAEKRAGCRLCAGYGGASLHHLARNGGLPRDSVAMTIADYVAACLAGVIATEPSHAASWGLLDVASREWDLETVDRLGLPAEILPSIRRISMPLGPVRGDLARRLGLSPNTQVCLPIGDNQASIIGVAGLARDVAIVNLGTGGQISIPRGEPVSIGGFETRPMPFGGYVLVGASLCGGWSYTYLRRFIQELVRQFTGMELDDETAYKRMNRLAADAAPGSAGLIVNPYFSGTRDDPDLRGSVRGIDAQNFTAGNLARAFIEGMVGELADLFHAVEHPGVTRIAASGNAVRANDLARETIETLFGRTCERTQHREEAAFGAAYAAAIATCPTAIPSRTAHGSPHSFLISTRRASRSHHDRK